MNQKNFISGELTLNLHEQKQRLRQDETTRFLPMFKFITI